MLLIIGKCLNVTKRTVEPANSAPFDVTVVHLLVGKSRVEYVDLAKDFGPAPAEGSEAALRVSVQAYVSGKVNAGEVAKYTPKAGYNYVAWEDVSERIKIAAPTG